jgi:hypothetical protein
MRQVQINDRLRRGEFQAEVNFRWKRRVKPAARCTRL